MAAAAAADPSAVSRAVPAESEVSAAAPRSPSSLSLVPGIPSPEPSDLSPRKLPTEEAALPSSDAARAKKQAWRRPPNGSAEAGAAVIGDAASWPALSESAKAFPKISPSDSPVSLADAPVSSPAGPEISSPSSKSSSNPSGLPNHMQPVRPRSMKRGGGSGGGGGSSSIAAADGGAALPSPPPTSSPLAMANSDKQAPRELPSGDQNTKNTNWNHASSAGGSGSQAHNGGDHVRSHGGNRRWNNGAARNNYSNLRDGERGGYDGHQRNSGGRDVRVQPRGARPYIRPPGPPVTPPFVGPPPQVGPYGNPMVFPDMPSPVFYVTAQPPPGTVPFVHHPAMPPAMFYPPIDPQRASLLKQIDFYFSPENLCRDVYLRQNMDEQGWVPISLIAGFNRVRQITSSIEFIMDTLRLSIVVEVQGEKVRKRNDWMNWLLPPSTNEFANAASRSPTAVNSDNAAAHLQSLAIEGCVHHNSTRMPNRNEAFLGRSGSGNLSNPAVNHNWDENGQVAAIADSDRIRSIRSLVRSDTF